MRIDVVSIFPGYLAPLELSLVGRAARTGLLDLRVHDLRDWTHDRHRTVDDTPYGGGAGMVMKPEPWGEAMDELLADTSAPADPVVLLMTPSGRPFDQQLATELADESRLVFVCGRYEGIDARVAEHLRGRVRTIEVSIGDYVLNGGEAAALVIVEAVVRLLPGVIGNPESLTEESHAAGHDRLLEYPIYTKPPSWRGLDVPDVLLSGHHGEVTRWRREQAVLRTGERRPELLPATDQPIVLSDATPQDAGELLTLQRAAYLAEGRLYDTFEIPPLTESLPELTDRLRGDSPVLVARRAGRLLGSVRAAAVGDVWEIGRLMVAPDAQGHGLGATLLDAVEQRAPDHCRRARLFTGAGSEANLRFYLRAGYTEAGRSADPSGVELVVLEKSLS